MTVPRPTDALRGHPPARWAGAAAPAVALAWAAGPPGAVAGVGVAAAGLASAPVAVALGHVWLVALLPAGPAPATLVVVEAAFLASLAAPDDADAVRTALATAVAAALLAGVAWLALPGSVAIAGFGVLVAGAALAGALDRLGHARLAAAGGRP